ncbi:PREDICTED: uncharacterized protein LOC109335484 [Lupinus angustifolius]|uniref:uncharacterized protein LOC109335484 n=1 Tax=Lupinus angustifolius TaxID=3871 RepID=UPI00092F6551|nr:PREDICTED: uncharacterized protein LOC109335484 [Lupinus angustifolius]
MTFEAGCSAIIQKSLPEKNKDQGSFTISITIGELSVGKTLLDLGANINLMPLSMLKRIGDLEIKPTRMTLQHKTMAGLESSRRDHNNEQSIDDPLMITFQQIANTLAEQADVIAATNQILAQLQNNVNGGVNHQGYASLASGSMLHNLSYGKKIYQVMGCSDVHKVDFAMFMLKGEAKHWWRSARGRLDALRTTITWEGLDDILGMDWLSANQVVLNCSTRTVEFPSLCSQSLPNSHVFKCHSSHELPA